MSNDIISYKYCPLFPNHEYRSQFMTEVFELTYHGGGGFTYSEVYNMPISHRRFSLKKIKEHLEQIQRLRDEQNEVITESTDVNKIKIPDFVKSKQEESTFVSKVKSKK